jgi:hypothetical protein
MNEYLPMQIFGQSGSRVAIGIGMEFIDACSIFPHAKSIPIPIATPTPIVRYFAVRGRLTPQLYLSWNLFSMVLRHKEWLHEF